jgi:S-layer protein
MAYTVDQLSTFFKNANAGTAPTAAQTLQLQAFANQNAAGTLTNDQAFASTVDLASDTTTAVSVGTYEFFLGYAPSQAGLTSLNSAYVGTGAQAGLNGENRFIAQSVSLALQNTTAKAAFNTSYGSLSVADATRAAYNIIIGNATATAAGVNVENAIAYLTSATSIAYYTAFVKANVPGLTTAADIDLAVKAAIVGEILYAATSYNFGAGLGSYASATTTLIKDLADDGVLAANNANGIDLFAAYGGTGTVGSSLTLTTGVDTPVATGNNDTINATQATLTALDTIDGLAGNDTLIIADTAGAFSTAVAGLTVKNVETVQFKSVGTGTVDTTAWTGVTSLQTTTVGGVAATAAGTTNISVTDGTLAAGTVVVNGGAAVSVTTVSASTGTITVGGTTAPTGAVTIKATETGAAVQGAITVTGGTTVSVTETAGNAVNTTSTMGAVSVTGTSATTSVSVTQSAAATADASTVGVVAGTVTINDANGAHATKAGTITSVTVANSAAVSITDNSLATLNLSGKVGTVGVTTGAGATVSALALNLGAGTTGAVTLGSNYKTLNVAASGANTVADVTASAATALNVSGTAALTLTAATGLTAVTAVNVTGSAGLTATLTGLTALAKVDTTGTTGTSSITLDATKGVTVAGGAGSETITLNGALKSGTSVTLGAGNDRLLGTTAVTTSATTVVDGGDGTDTVSSLLINAGNGSMFKNFEVLGLGSNTLDAALLTGSTITGLELTTGGGTGTFTNVTKSQSLTVSGTAAAGTTTLTFSDVAGTADAYAISFNASTSGTTSSPTTVDARIVSIAGIENVTINSGSAAGVNVNTISLTDAAAKSLTITGSQAATVSFTGAFGSAGANGLATVDASAATGAVTIDFTTGTVGIATAGLTVSTGAGADVLTFGTAATVSTGAGNDTVTLAGASTVDLGAGNDIVTTSAHASTITGGAGNDDFRVALSVGAANMTTITDAAAGDKITFVNHGTEVFNATKVNVDSATTLTDALNAASTGDGGTTNSIISWFQYGGNTYIVEDNSAAATFGAADIVVKLTGLVDLSTATGATTHIITLA